MKTPLKTQFLYFLLCAFVFSIVLAIEWPGIFNGDSVVDIRNAHNGKFGYWRSYLYLTYLFSGRFFDYQLGGYSILQMLIVAFIISCLARRIHAFAPKLTAVSILLVVLCPLNSLYAIHPIRDIITSWLMLSATLELYRFLLTREPPYIAMLLLGVVAALRPDGILLTLVGALIVA